MIRQGPTMQHIHVLLEIAGYEGATFDAIYDHVGWNRKRLDVRRSLDTLVKQGFVETDDSGMHFRLVQEST